jgi:tRNA A-37 threonylcarbamoyl transferase component Bud32/membrane-associated phospholipid phosphatase
VGTGSHPTGNPGDLGVSGAPDRLRSPTVPDRPHPHQPVPDRIARGRLRRRPSGEAPPLPRKLDVTGYVWLGLAVGVVLLWMVIAVASSVPAEQGELPDNPGVRLGVEVALADLALLRGLARLRADALTDVMLGLHALGSRWPIRVLVWGIPIALVVLRRWRHLFVLLGATLLVGGITSITNSLLQRPRPVGIEILGAWRGFSQPSRPIALLTALLIGVLYTLVPSGRPRAVGKWAVAGVVALLGVARMYLAVDHPTDVLVGVVFGVAIPLAAFRLLVPNEVFPVAYRRGRSAHLDVGGRRGEAIQRALEDQLGLVVLEVKPVGLEGSAGSTPLRIKVKGEPDTHLFAKLYARNHLRADRWYKLGRTLLYGRLEDEKPFNTVRRFVQYEDYALRLMKDADLPVPYPYGIVELTPEREYLIVMEFFDGAEEIGKVDVDDAIIDGALGVVRCLWDAGLAHRDLKPANLMVRDGEVLLIDVFFTEVRPTPWRQAVDLANMMLVLALRSSPDKVYERALRQFSAEEISEAFAATHGLTMPSQLRLLMRNEGRDLHGEFIALLPRPPGRIAIQRWSARRVLLTVSVLLGALLIALMAIQNLTALGRV